VRNCLISIEVAHVSYNYSTHPEHQTPPAIQDLSLRIAAGEMVAIIGQNGSGKSTLAKLLAAILHPDSGSISIDNLRTNAGGEELWTIRQRVGIVFQNPDDQLVANTVIDDIAFGPENLGLPRFEIEDRVQEAMRLLDLEEISGVAISELSVGQKQRVAIAGVLAMRPRYLLLDEPTSMISGKTARTLLATLHRLAKEQRIAIVYITHAMHEVIDFQRIVVMQQGRILLEGSPASVFAHTGELYEAGLDVPMITRLGQRLRARGLISLSETILSSEQLLSEFPRPKEVRSGDAHINVVGNAE
jgi:energy-coupling factor transport system ATP-binding protein